MKRNFLAFYFIHYFLTPVFLSNLVSTYVCYILSIGFLLPFGTDNLGSSVYNGRSTVCRYAVVGCGWRGAARAAAAHEAACAHPRRPAHELVELLRQRERDAAEHLQVYAHLLDLLSYEKITFNGMDSVKYGSLAKP